MKRYVAFHGNANSGIQTKENAVEWASSLLTDTKASKVHLCEVIEVIERETIPIVSTPYMPPQEQPQAVAKAA